MAALLHRRQAQRPDGGCRLQRRGLRPRVNSDLIGKFVNIASRTAGFIAKRFEGRLAEADPAAAAAFGAGWSGSDAVATLYEQREFGKAIREIMALADRVNRFIDAEKPWDLARHPDQSERLHQVCSDALRAFHDLSVMLAPVLPDTTARIGQFLGVAVALGSTGLAPGRWTSDRRL